MRSTTKPFAASVRMSATAVFALLAGPAMACTLCNSSQAMSVRARLLEPDLLWNAAAILLPLLGLLAIIALAVREPTRSAEA